jgi:hypothetical protein
MSSLLRWPFVVNPLHRKLHIRKPPFNTNVLITEHTIPLAIYENQCILTGILAAMLVMFVTVLRAFLLPAKYNHERFEKTRK